MENGLIYLLIKKMCTLFLILESGQTWDYGVISKVIPGFLIKGPIMCSEVLGEDQLADSAAILGGGCSAVLKDSY